MGPPGSTISSNASTRPSHASTMLSQKIPAELIAFDLLADAGEDLRGTALLGAPGETGPAVLRPRPSLASHSPD